MVKIASAVVVAALAAGCGGEAGPTALSTVTVTATVTTTSTPDPDKSSLESATASTPVEPVLSPGRRLELTVFTDGCGVIRTETRLGEFRNLTWVVRDSGGFQVLGRNAEGETRYRYFQSGTYTVALEAWTGDHYAPVSNTVTVHC